MDGSEASSELLNRLYPEGKNKLKMILPIEANDLITQYELGKEKEKEAADMKDEAANKLKSILGDKESIFAQSNIFNHIQESKKSENSKANVPIMDPLLKKRILQYMENGAIFSFKKDFSNLLSYWKESDFLQIWVEKLLKDLIIIISTGPDISHLFNNIDIEFQVDEAIAVSNSYDELFFNVWFIFQEIFNEQLKYDDFNTSTEALIKKIDNYITSNFTEAIDNQLLSERFGLVPSYLSKLFRKYVGMSPSDYISHLRIEKAKELIKNDSEILVKDIASITGFCDPFHFSKVFKRETGMSPKEYKSFINAS